MPAGAVTLPAAPAVVLLRGGRGAKAAHNGQTARLGASKGSWTTVVLGDETVKWRTGHWEEATAVAAVAPPAVRDIFSWLPDAVALEVLALLPTPDLCRARMASRALHGLRQQRWLELVSGRAARALRNSGEPRRRGRRAPAAACRRGACGCTG